MLAVEQRCDDSIQTHRLTLTRSTCHQQVWHLGEVKREVLVLNGTSYDHWKLGTRLLELLGAYRRVHRHRLLGLVRYLDTDSASTWNRRDNTYTQRLEALRNIILQIANL